MKTLQDKVDTLMDENQPLKAWELVKDADDYELKTKVWNKVKHAFDTKAYRDYYMKDLSEHPVSDEIAIDATKHDARFRWLLPKLMELNPKSVLDIGCADGYLGLTLGRWGTKCVGINLYLPSIIVARQRAELYHVPAQFVHGDFMEYQTQHEAVVFFEILEHTPDPARAIAKAYDLVKEGGRLYISTPRAGDSIGVKMHLADETRERWDVDDKPAGHLRLFTEDEMRHLVMGYKVVNFDVDEDKSFCVEIVKGIKNE